LPLPIANRLKNMTDTSFWIALDQLLAGSEVVIDRPKGSPHPDYPDVIYPLDYGYLAGTMSADGGGIDVWVGSHGKGAVTAAICTVDLLKRDVEIKILVGCSDADVETIQHFTETNAGGWTLLRRQG
jgi:inorganic pyrophosphatase